MMISSGRKVESVNLFMNGNYSSLLSERILLDHDVIWRFITKVFCLKTLKSVNTSETSTDNGLLAQEIKQNKFSDLLPQTRKRLETVMKDEKWKDILFFFFCFKICVILNDHKNNKQKNVQIDNNSRSLDFTNVSTTISERYGMVPEHQNMCREVV